MAETIQHVKRTGSREGKGAWWFLRRTRRQGRLTEFFLDSEVLVYAQDCLLAVRGRKLPVEPRAEVAGLGIIQCTDSYY